MGTYIDVYLTHSLPSWRDPAGALAVLSATEVASNAVAEYWRSVQPYGRERARWEAEDQLAHGLHYSGPGSLHVCVTHTAVRIHTGGRWRGFLSIPPLRSVHLAAFRAIADAFGSAHMAVSHDSVDGILDAFLAGASQEQLIDALRAALGPPQASLDTIEPAVAAATDHGVPDVWYLDTRPGAADAGVAG